MGGSPQLVVSWPDYGLQNSIGLGIQSGGGMENAWTAANPNGIEGMTNATVVSGGQVC
jgi:hypothetical protein